MIELFMSDTCPYCIKVVSFLKREKVQFVPKDRNKFRDELMKLGGKTQVPFLHDPERGVKMYESDEIIDYVREHYAGQK